MKITLNKLLLGYLQKKNAFSRAALDGVADRGSLTFVEVMVLTFFAEDQNFAAAKKLPNKIDLQSIFKILDSFLKGSNR